MIRSTIAWMGLGIVLVVACSEDPDDGTDGLGTGGAGAAAGSDSGETAAGEPPTGDGGKGATSSEGGAGQAGTIAGAGAPNHSAGGVAGDEAAAGAAGRAEEPSVAGQGHGGEGGAGGERLRVDCPALGEPFVLRFDEDPLTEEELAIARGFYCDLEEYRANFTIERFEVTTLLFEVISSPSTYENYDTFNIVPDCEPLGYLEVYPPYDPNDSIVSGSVLARVLEPGFYTRISCQRDMYVEQVPVPPPATNIDCAHAKPLPRGSYFPGEPLSEGLDETRVLDATSLFYSLTLEETEAAADWHVSIHTHYSLQGSRGADLTLRRVSDAWSQGSLIFKLDGRSYGSFENVPPGDYCLEVSVFPGLKYEIYYTADESWY